MLVRGIAFSCLLLITGVVRAEPLPDQEALAGEYRAWLDVGRTPARIVRLVRERSPGFTMIDPVAATPTRVQPGDRLLFVDHDRTAILVVVGQRPIAEAGIRLIATHIDTPSPRLALMNLAKGNELQVKAISYGGMRPHHWLYLPLAVVGRVSPGGGGEIDIALGLEDDFTLMATDVDKRDGSLLITTGSIPSDGGDVGTSLMRVLSERHGLIASDLQAAELFVVPRHGAREVGVDRALIGAHGQDDRANSYLAWRSLIDLGDIPPQTAVVWLTDREEEGSHHQAGAASRFFELVVAYLVRAQGERVTEAVLGRALGRSVVLSADTPPALNANWPEAQELQNAPVLGKGPALFPYTGRGGKHGGSAASPELVRSVMSSFARAGVPVQHGALGRVDEGGGGTVAQFLAHRGMDVVDIGVAAMSLHSPMELTAKDDLWAGYIGFRAWLAEGGRAPRRRP